MEKTDDTGETDNGEIKIGNFDHNSVCDGRMFRSSCAYKSAERSKNEFVSFFMMVHQTARSVC
jgi:hypothetical protein